MRSIDEISIANPEKPLVLAVGEKEYYRCPIHTHFIKPGENLSHLMERYVKPYFQEGDVADINDFGGDVLAISPKSPFDKPLLQALLKDNPAGNGKEMTPFVLLREKKEAQN